MPGEVSERLTRWVLRTFPEGSAEQVLAVLADLPEHVTAPTGPARERVQAALVVRTGGDWHLFQEMVGVALADWRDALLAADLAHEDWPDRLDAVLG